MTAEHSIKRFISQCRAQAVATVAADELCSHFALSVRLFVVAYVKCQHTLAI